MSQKSNPASWIWQSTHESGIEHAGFGNQLMKMESSTQDLAIMT